MSVGMSLARKKINQQLVFLKTPLWETALYLVGLLNSPLHIASPVLQDKRLLLVIWEQTESKIPTVEEICWLI
jgi:hypothetical protein